jgi:RNA polymerase sigma-70 factor (sigma-E family)
VAQGDADEGPGADRAVAELYQAHAEGLVRLAVVMLGHRASAEDVVQEAFLGLYRHWDRLTDTGNALRYVRSSVLNGCRSAIRRAHREARSHRLVHAESAESVALVSDEHGQVLSVIRLLPRRQREALVLRFYLELGEQEIAAWMGVSRGTVKSTTSRALSALGRLLREDQ